MKDECWLGTYMRKQAYRLDFEDREFVLVRKRQLRIAQMSVTRSARAWSGGIRCAVRANISGCTLRLFVSTFAF